MRKKRKKQALTPWSLGSIPITPVETKNPVAPEDSKTLLARLQREEEEAKRNADPIFQAEQSLNKTMRELRKLSIEFWSRPVNVIGREYQTESARDMTFSVEATTAQYTLDDAKAAFNTWFATTFAKSGYELTEVGGQRLVRFGLAQAKFGADMSNASAWQAAFEHLKDNLKAFQTGDFAEVARPVQAPAPRASLNDIEKLNIGGNEDDARKAKRLAQELMYAQGSPLHQAWMESLYQNFNFVPSNADLQYIYNELFPRNNWSYVDQRSFDRARRHMVSIGRWPEPLLTADEKMARDIEQGPALGTLGFGERWNLMTKVKRLQDQAN
jgi:hypothetical protein